MISKAMSMSPADKPSASDESFETELASNLAAALSGLTMPVSIVELEKSQFSDVAGQWPGPTLSWPGNAGQVLYVTFDGDGLVMHSESRLARGYGPVEPPEAAIAAIARALKGTMKRGFVTRYTDDVLHIASIVERVLPDARRHVSEATIEKMVDALIETQDPTAQVRAEIDAGNAKARMRFMNNFLTLTAEQVAENAGSRARNRHQAASRWKKEGRIFSISWQGLERYPAFQFKEGRPLPSIASVLAVLPKRMSPWEVAFWFVSTNGWLGGKAPRELLESPETLAEAGRHESETVIG